MAYVMILLGGRHQGACIMQLRGEIIVAQCNPQAYG